jgi:hypothetical protein|tara:strand:+ start:450 stop:770 length:321 start_codon:yes stop_codon:yes gene_type:complete
VKRILLFALIMSAQLNAAQVYKCTVNDVITFSDQPCSANAQIVKVQAGKSNAKANPSKLVNQFLKQTRLWKNPAPVKIVNHYKRWEQNDSDARKLLALEVKAKKWL